MGRAATVLKQKKKYIAGELLVGISKSNLIVFLVLGFVVVYMITTQIVNNNREILTLQSESSAWELTDFLNGYSRMVEMLAVNQDVIELLKTTKTGEQITQKDKYPGVYAYMCAMQRTDPENILAVWLGDIDANVLTQSDGFTSGADFEIAQRAWYVCTQTGKTFLTEPYTDASTGKRIVSAATPIYDEKGNVQGVAGLDISLENINTIMEQYVIGENGYVTLFSKEGIILYSPNEDWIEKKIADVNGVTKELTDALLNQTNCFLEYKINGEKKYGATDSIGETGYMVLSCMGFMQYYGKLMKFTGLLIVIFMAGLVVLYKKVEKIAFAITKPIEELNDVAKKLAAGNLDVDMQVTLENEVGQLGNAIEKTVARLKEYIVYINEIADVLGEMANGKLKIELRHEYVGEFETLKNAMMHISESMSEVMLEIQQTASQVGEGADELANASGMLAEGATRQNAAADEIVETVRTMTEQVNMTKEEAEHSAKKTAEVKELMRKNHQQMNTMLEAMNKIHTTSQEMVGIIATIEEIADETNLLALNASIEAARAGEAGRGFAVVAGDIGKLASESLNAVNNTSDLIGISTQEIERGNEIAQSVMKAISDAVEAVDNVSRMIYETADNAVQQAENMEVVEQKLEDISHGISDNSAFAQQSSATSEELAAQAATLNDLIGKFKF